MSNRPWNPQTGISVFCMCTVRGALIRRLLKRKKEEEEDVRREGGEGREEGNVNAMKFHLTTSLRCIMKSSCNFKFDLL